MRYRTVTPTLSGSGEDRRIQRTRTLLHQALSALIREKAYDRITVAEILDRAGVSRSTFYIHFRDKDDLLASGMRTLLLDVLSMQSGATTEGAERMVAFSLPLFTHIHQHRRAGRARLGERGRAILHQHLRRVLSEWIVQTLAADQRLSRSRRTAVVPQLLAQHVASTFVLVLHWWLDHGGSAAPAEADRLFRMLVMPVLRATSS